jgi:GNAT superfamily N-acetyltransferase
MAVRDDWQGRGVGTESLRAALDLADNGLNLSRVELTVYTDNAAGTGWDPALVSLGMFLRGEEIEDPVAWMNSPEVREFNRRSVHAWGEAAEAAGASTGGEVATAVETSLTQLAHYYSEADADQSEDKTR